MKRLILFLFTVTFIHTSHAQIVEEGNTSIDSPYRTLKHEVGFGIVGGGDVRQMLWALPGVTYRYFLPQGAIRVLVGGTLNQNSYAGGSDQLYGFVGRVGYQYHVMLGRFMPRIGCDLSGGMYEEQYNYGVDKNTTSSLSVGLSPTIGMEFWFSPKFSMALDTRFDIAYRSMETEYTYVDWWTNQPITTKTTSSGINTTVGPISSFTFGFHF